VIDTIDLDHVAVAVEHRRDAWARYRTELGGAWIGSGATAGFANNQLSYTAGMNLEILRPHRVDLNDFLRRFLDHTGPGPHHLTFKVADIRVAIDALTAAGYPPVSINLEYREWMEAFLHPKASHGVVVQVAESHDEGWEHPPPPAQFPAAAPASAASLLRTTHLVASLEGAGTLFEDVLLGKEVLQGIGADGDRWRELAWPGGGRVRLVEPSSPGPLADWLGGRTGRVHHLAFAVDDPTAITGATAHDDGTWVVAPEDNLGTRLVLEPR
jgi:methylmalonyl-CoA/ethylmalonyl-CoA epimerase